MYTVFVHRHYRHTDRCENYEESCVKRRMKKMRSSGEIGWMETQSAETEGGSVKRLDVYVYVRALAALC